jgi:predicted transcriptional regulator
MEKEFPKNQKQLTKEGYVIISSYFLDYCVEILGTGPGMLYIQLLNYCHKGKDIAWPTLATLGRKMQFTPKSITKFHQVLLKHGLIKKIKKGKTPSGNYSRNIYQVIPIHRVKNTLTTGKNFPKIEENITPNIGKKLPTNNSNPNITNSTAANGEKDAVAVNFKKLKEKGDLSASVLAQAEEKMRTVRERMLELNFKEGFIEKILKEYSVEKIEEKLDLLMERRNIQSPAGWLRAALKNDYQGKEPVRENEGDKCRGSIYQTRLESAGRMNPPPTKTKTSSEDKKILSTEEARERFHSLREKLEAMNTTLTKNY